MGFLSQNTSGKIEKVNYSEDGLLIDSFILSYTDGSREYINVDTNYIRSRLNSLSMLDTSHIMTGLQRIIREGNDVNTDLWLCGAAGRVIFLENIELLVRVPYPPMRPVERRPALPTLPSPTFEPSIQTEGAKINVKRIDGDRDISIINIDGQLVPGDEKRFADVAVRATDAIVLLNSPGGSLDTGIEIGRAIRIKGFSTLVADGSLCASACALAWLGGRPRFIAKHAQIGFHAAFVDDATKSVTSVGNAIAGAYLNELGLSTAAIAYMTQAQPNEIKWLTLEDATSIGLEVKEFVSEGVSE